MESKVPTVGIVHNGDEVYQIFSSDPEEEETYIIGKDKLKVFLYRAWQLAQEGKMRLSVFGMGHNNSMRYVDRLTRNVPNILEAMDTSSVANQEHSDIGQDAL